nr:MAG TPA: hypothetical protein [Bacteriophage sp.]
MEKPIFDRDASADTITFPTAPEAFIAYQEAGTGRNLNIHGKELMEKSVEILNESYERGKTGERMPFPESEEEARQILSDMGNEDHWERSFMRRYIRFMLFWTRTAYEQGQREAQA